MRFDATKYTLAEIDTIEQKSGRSISSLGDDTAPQAKLMAAIVYVERRRRGDKITFTDAMGMTLAEMQDFLGMNTEDAEDPKES